MVDPATGAAMAKIFSDIIQAKQKREEAERAGRLSAIQQGADLYQQAQTGFSQDQQQILQSLMGNLRGTLLR